MTFGQCPDPCAVLPPLVDLLGKRPELAHRGVDWDKTSLAGVLEDRPLPRRLVDFYKSSASVVGMQLQSERSSTLVQFFFAQLVDLLIADSLAVREGTRSVVASSLSPLVIAPFVRLLHVVVRSFFDDSGLTARRGEAECVLLVDQVVSIWKLFLDRKLLQSDLSSLSSVFEDLLLCLARYIAQLLIEKSPHALCAKTAPLCRGPTSGRCASRWWSL